MNLPLSLTGWAVIWANLTGPEMNTYHLSSPSPTQEFPAIKYINNKWYYLYWDKGSYYTKWWLKIPTLISFGLGTHCVPAIVETLWKESEDEGSSNSCIQNQESQFTEERSDQPSLPVLTEKPLPYRDFAFGLNETSPAQVTMASTTETTNRGVATEGGGDLYRAYVYTGTGGGVGGHRGNGTVFGGSGPAPEVQASCICEETHRMTL